MPTKWDTLKEILEKWLGKLSDPDRETTGSAYFEQRVEARIETIKTVLNQMEELSGGKPIHEIGHVRHGSSRDETVTNNGE